MSGVNKVILLGNLGRDPEVRHLENGSTVANISLATSETYKDKQGNKIENTEWHSLEMWKGLAKVAEQYLSQGDTIYVEGKIKTDKWQDEQGEAKSRVKIRVLSMTIIKTGKRDNNAQEAKPKQPKQSPQQQTAEEVDDLPF